MAWLSLSLFHLELRVHCGPHYKIVVKNQSFLMDFLMSTNMGGNQVVVCGCNDPDCTKVGFGVPCPHRRIQFSVWLHVGSKPNLKV